MWCWQSCRNPGSMMLRNYAVPWRWMTLLGCVGGGVSSRNTCWMMIIVSEGLFLLHISILKAYSFQQCFFPQRLWFSAFLFPTKGKGFYTLAKGYCHHVCIHLSVHPFIILDHRQWYIPSHNLYVKSLILMYWFKAI